MKIKLIMNIIWYFYVGLKSNSLKKHKIWFLLYLFNGFGIFFSLNIWILFIRGIYQRMYYEKSVKYTYPHHSRTVQQRRSTVPGMLRYSKVTTLRYSTVLWVYCAVRYCDGAVRYEDGTNTRFSHWFHSIFNVEP